MVGTLLAILSTSREICMETTQHFEAMSAFCRQRSKMDGEDELFWLSEAELLARLAENARRLTLLQIRRAEKAACRANAAGFFIR